MNSKFALRVLGASLAVVATGSFVGALAGTVAWYAYSTRVSISYEGTSVANTEMLQIGLDITGLNTNDPSAPHYYSLEGHDLVQTVTVNSRTYAFADEGAGMSSTTIKDYLFAKGSASTELKPVTSRYYDYDSIDVANDQTGTVTESSFNLYKAPMSGYTAFYNAENDAYANLSLAFRIKLSNGSYSSGDAVWINSAQVDPSENGQLVHEALRIRVEGANNFILNPSADASGTDKVGGVLCLKRDSEYYDTDMSNEEILYGDFVSTNSPRNFATDTFEDVNGSGYVVGDVPNTFAGYHHEGTKGYSSSDFVARTAKYRSVSEIAAEDDGSGGLTNGYPVSIIEQQDTSPSATTVTNIGLVNLKIYLEGWDYAVIDDAISHGFTLGLQFQVDTIH